MKKKFLLVFTLLCTLLFMIGCKSNEIKDNNYKRDIYSVDGLDIDKLLKYKNSYVGDNSKVGGILSILPGNMFIKEFSLTNDSIKVDYEYKGQSNMEEEDLQKYFNDENTKKIFLNNITTLFILIKNVENIELNLHTENQLSFNISRKEVEDFYGKDLRKYAEDKLLWEKEVLKNKLASKESIESFFEAHSIIIK